MQNQPLPDTSECEYAIVGGGVIGLSVAYALAKAGKKAVVLERGEVGMEATWASGGMLRPITEFGGNKQFLKLCLDSLSLYKEFVDDLEQETGVDIEYNDRGNILVAMREEELKRLDEKYSIARSLGIKAKLLNCEQAQQAEPGLSACAGALLMPCDHMLNNRTLAEALTLGLQKRGIPVFEQCRVTSLLEEGEVVKGVAVGQKIVRAKAVICTCGSWADELIPGLGVVPIRGQMIRYALDGLEVHHVISNHPFYLIPRKDGTLVVGSTVEPVGFKKEVTPEGIAHLKGGAEVLLPALQGKKIVEQWAGFRPKSSDEFPFIGAVREGLYVATGHFRNGILLAPITAKLMLDYLEGKDELRAFSPRRVLWKSF